MNELSEIYRELGEVQARLNAVRDTMESEGRLRKERHDEVKGSLLQLSTVIKAHTEATDLRIKKLEADNNRSKGAMGVVMFLIAAVTSTITVLVSKAVAASKFFN